MLSRFALPLQVAKMPHVFTVGCAPVSVFGIVQSSAFSTACFVCESVAISLRGWQICGVVL